MTLLHRLERTIDAWLSVPGCSLWRAWRSSYWQPRKDVRAGTGEQ